MHPSQSESLRAKQHDRMLELQSACDALSRDLMIEIVEAEGTTYGATDVAHIVADAAQAGIEPRWWKLPSLEADAWRELERVLDDSHSDARVIVLGGGESLAALDASFRIAAQSPRAAGFAVGRSVFGDAMKAFFAGHAVHERVVAEVAERYETLVRGWRAANGGKS
jgi:5-dehydro-2-deoxygluconokinase